MDLNLVFALGGALGLGLVYSVLAGLLRPRPRTSLDMLPDDEYRLHSFRHQPVLDRLLAPLLAQAARLLGRVLGSHDQDRKKLVQAGFPQPFYSLGDFYGWKVLSGLVLFLAGLFLAAFTGSRLLLVAGLVLGVAGLYLPDLALHRAIRKRQELFRVEMAYALDRMALLLTGSTFENVLEQVAAWGGGLFVQEMDGVARQIRTGGGQSLEQILASVKERYPLPEYEDFCSAVLLSRSLGSPLAGVLGNISRSIQSEVENDLLSRGTSSVLTMVLGMGLSLLGIIIVVAGPAVYMLFLRGGGF